MLGISYVLLISSGFSQLCGIDASIKILETSVESQKNKVLWHSYGTPRLIYALCDDDYASLSRKCKVTREKSPHSNETDSCDVTLILDHSEEEEPYKFLSIEVVSLGNDDVLLYMGEEAVVNPYIKFVTLNLGNCRVKGEYEMSIYNPVVKASEAVRIAAFDDSYEIHYLIKDEHSRDLIHSRIVVSAKGKIIDGPSKVETVISRGPFARSPLPSIIPIAMDSRDKGVAYLKGHINRILPRMTVLLPDGTKKNFEVLSGGDSSYPNTIYEGFSISTANDVITVCSNLIPRNLDLPGNLGVKCMQYNEEDKVNFETNLIGDRDFSYSGTATFNLPDGGILVSALHLCETCEKQSVLSFHAIPSKDVRLSVFKIDASGRTVGKVLLEKYDFDNVELRRPNFLFYMSEMGDYCITMTNYYKKFTYCFADADFVSYPVE